MKRFTLFAILITLVSVAGILAGCSAGAGTSTLKSSLTPTRAIPLEDDGFQQQPSQRHTPSPTPSPTP